MYSITISQYSCMPSSMDVAARSGSPPPPQFSHLFMYFIGMLIPHSPWQTRRRRRRQCLCSSCRWPCSSPYGGDCGTSDHWIVLLEVSVCVHYYITQYIKRKKERKEKKTIYSSLKGLEKFPASAAWEIYTHVLSV